MADSKSKPPGNNVTPIRHPRKLSTRVDKTKLTQARDDEALRLYVQCYTLEQIGNEIGTSRISAWRMIQRGLERYSEQRPEITAQARETLASRYEHLLARWFPLAIGVDDNGESTPASLDAAEYVLKVLDRWAKIHGVDTAPPVNINTLIVSPDEMRRDILAGLDAVEERTKVIEGVLTRDDD